MPGKTRRSKKQKRSYRQRKTRRIYRRHRGGEGAVSVYGRTLPKSTFNHLVQNGKLSEFANSLD